MLVCLWSSLPLRVRFAFFTKFQLNVDLFMVFAATACGTRKELHSIVARAAECPQPQLPAAPTRSSRKKERKKLSSKQASQIPIPNPLIHPRFLTSPRTIPG